MCIYDRAPKDMAFSEELKGHTGLPTNSSNLPHDVIERVFALLPLKEKLVCRTVCRCWNSILSTDGLLTFTSNTSSSSRSSSYGNACFMLTTKGPVAYALDPLTNIWHKFHKPSCPGASVLAAAHGLVCVGNQVSECRSLIIFNLLCNTWELLPNMLHVSLLHKVTMARDPLSHSYVVVVTGEDTSKFRGRRAYQLHTEVFDSISGSWRMAGDAVPEAKFGSDPGVWHNGIFYCITELPYGITAFDLAKGRWMSLSVEMPTGISYPSLVSCKGRLMMVGIQDDNVLSEVHISNASPALSDIPTTDRLSQLSRSWSWSGPLQSWVSLQLRSTLFSSWPAVGVPTSPLAASAPRLSSLLSVCSSQLSPPRSCSLMASHPPPELRRSIRVWSFTEGKHWMAICEMPEQLCMDFMGHLMPKTPLVCAGVGDEVCVSSHVSPRPVVLNLNNMGWRYAASDPAFPRNRDTHLLSFTVQPDTSCLP